MTWTDEDQREFEGRHGARLPEYGVTWDTLRNEAIHFTERERTRIRKYDLGRILDDERARIRREIEPVIAEMREWWKGVDGLINVSFDPDAWADRLERALGGEA